MDTRWKALLIPNQHNHKQSQRKNEQKSMGKIMKALVFVHAAYSSNFIMGLNSERCSHNLNFMGLHKFASDYY